MTIEVEPYALCIFFYLAIEWILSLLKRNGSWTQRLAVQIFQRVASIGSSFNASKMTTKG